MERSTRKNFDLTKNLNYKKEFYLIIWEIVLFSSSSFSTVLEVGCGFGRITKLLLSNFPDILEYVAIDLSADQIENAKKYVKPVIETKEHNPLNFIVSDIQSFQGEKKYDFVVSQVS